MGSESKKEEQAVEPTHVVELPVLVEADNVHMRYCASVVRDGKPDRTLYGEYRVGESWSGDSERQKQLAIDDLRRKIQQRLGEPLK